MGKKRTLVVEASKVIETIETIETRIGAYVIPIPGSNEKPRLDIKGFFNTIGQDIFQEYREKVCAYVGPSELCDWVLNSENKAFTQAFFGQYSILYSQASLGKPSQFLGDQASRHKFYEAIRSNVYNLRKNKGTYIRVFQPSRLFHVASNANSMVISPSSLTNLHHQRADSPISSTSTSTQERSVYPVHEPDTQDQAAAVQSRMKLKPSSAFSFVESSEQAKSTSTSTTLIMTTLFFATPSRSDHTGMEVDIQFVEEDASIQPVHLNETKKCGEEMEVDVLLSRPASPIHASLPNPSAFYVESEDENPHVTDEWYLS